MYFLSLFFFLFQSLVAPSLQRNQQRNLELGLMSCRQESSLMSVLWIPQAKLLTSRTPTLTPSGSTMGPHMMLMMLSAVWGKTRTNDGHHLS